MVTRSGFNVRGQGQGRGQGHEEGGLADWGQMVGGGGWR